MQRCVFSCLRPNRDLVWWESINRYLDLVSLESKHSHTHTHTHTHTQLFCYCNDILSNRSSHICYNFWRTDQFYHLRNEQWQEEISHLTAQSQSSSSGVFLANAGLTRMTSDGKIWKAGVLSSGWTMLTSSFRGVAGGSHSNVSFGDVKLDLPDVSTSSVWKLIGTYKHTSNDKSL